MSASTEIVRPRFFIIFRIICILLGVVGLTGSLMLLILSASQSIQEVLNAQGQTLPLMLIALTQSLILLIASIWLFKLKEFGRILILACIIWNLLQLLYFYFSGSSSMPLIGYSDSFAMFLFLLNIFILLYFLRRDVKAYIIAHGHN